MPDPSKNEIFQGFSYVAPEVAMTLAKSYAQNYNDLPQIDEQPSMVQNMVENFQHATLESGSSSEHNQEGGIIETDMSIPVPSARIQLPEDWGYFFVLIRLVFLIYFIGICKKVI